ncbi:winged helix DNA-binding domain-containing protein [Okibacterium endophyticum]
MTPVLTAAAVRQQRLANQLLSDRHARTPQAHVAEGGSDIADVVRHMHAMQGQDLAGLLWSLAVRSPNSPTMAQVRDAFDSRHLVRSWPMRGTLHAIAGEDLRWMLSLTAARTTAGLASRFRELNLGTAEFTRAAKAVESAFSAHERLSRADLMTAIQRGGVDPTGQRGPHLLGHLARQGLICLGPFESSEQLFVWCDDWIPSAPALTRDEALHELARRYLRGHGPASVDDLAWWAGITLGDARTAVASLEDDVERVSASGVELVRLSSSVSASPSSRLVHALPGFDETVLGYRNRAFTMHVDHGSRIVPGNNGVFMPTVQNRGRVVGTWSKKERARSIDIGLTPFESISTSTRTGFERSIQAYGAFRGKPVTVVVA